MKTQLIGEGCVHGRFQPFHLEHLEYVIEAKRRCRHLFVGLAKPNLDAVELRPLGRAREQAFSNPLNYYERATLIRKVLEVEGFLPDSYSIIPFPIDTPARLPFFVPRTITCFTTLVEPWNQEKINTLESFGYMVQVLWERDKRISGSSVRESLLSGDDAWTKLVPAAAVSLLQQWEIGERLRELQGRNGQAAEQTLAADGAAPRS